MIVHFFVNVKKSTIEFNILNFIRSQHDHTFLCDCQKKVRSNKKNYFCKLPKWSYFFLWLSKKSTIEFKIFIFVRSQKWSYFFWWLSKKSTIEYKNMIFENSLNDCTFLWMSKKVWSNVKFKFSKNLKMIVHFFVTEKKKYDRI